MCVLVLVFVGFPNFRVFFLRFCSACRASCHFGKIPLPPFLNFHLSVFFDLLGNPFENLPPVFFLSFFSEGKILYLFRHTFLLINEPRIYTENSKSRGI